MAVSICHKLRQKDLRSIESFKGKKNAKVPNFSPGAIYVYLEREIMGCG
jgi:hypothetical protein